MIHALAAALLVLQASAAAAQCRLALVLAMDVSASVDAQEYALQRDGLARALDAPDIREAILTGAPGHVSLAIYEWSGRYQQTVMLDWTTLDSPAALDRVVAHVAGARRSWKDYPTAMGYALGYAARLFETAPPCDRRVIDVSGDGLNNEGFLPDRAYAHFPLDDVTVNGLVIEGADAGLIDFYRAQVLRGPGAFLEVARTFDEFEAAMARKLLREVGGMILGSTGGQAWPPG
ncbi:DUF1194 domain-containing protein [Pseudooceanicola onchidii]|uniref:DUF1194 domain-containing protein n=1 Tax=Pseudooceanicola onchidii TaxID=2562279 RepID=UPI0010AAB116|nr:DUF1194 domain-containing protein [Pseudooceanicola onchidii]